MTNGKPRNGSDASRKVPANSVEVFIDQEKVVATEGELLVEAILREKDIPHICYHSRPMSRSGM